MVEEFEKAHEGLPFEPFTLELSSGRHIHVPHSDHILVTSKGIIAVEDDEGLVDVVSALHLVAIKGPSEAAA